MRRRNTRIGTSIPVYQARSRPTGSGVTQATLQTENKREPNLSVIAKFCRRGAALSCPLFLRSHHAHWTPEQLIRNFLLTIAQRGVERLERLVHGTHRIELRTH